MRTRRRSIAFTIIEVISVLGILLILLALVLSAISNTKISGFTANCKSQINQIRIAMEIYASDYPGYKQMFENVDFPEAPMRDPKLLEPYAVDSDILICKHTPACAREKFISTYVFTVLPPESSELYRTAYIQMQDRFEDDNSDYPIIYCPVHDQVYFYPRERHLDPKLNPPYINWLTRAGSIRSGRYFVVRSDDIARV